MFPRSLPKYTRSPTLLVLSAATAWILILASVSACNDGQDAVPRSQDGSSKQDALTDSAPVDCTLVSNSISDCLVGAAFAHCPGSQSPSAFCGVPGSCIWVSNGCPLSDWTYPLAADCETSPSAPLELSPTMASFMFAHGTKPWSKDRDMNVTVAVDSSLQSQTSTNVSCSPCSGPCDTPATPCGAGTDLMAIFNTPGTLLLRYHSTNAFAGWDLQIEIDPTSTPMAARACRLQFTDAISCTPQEPICADSGTVKFSEAPSSANWPKLHATFRLVFPDGMTITGQSSPSAN
jgi:hypothetical protein